MMTTNRLKVLLHNEKIGEIILLEGERNIFTFSDDYRENEVRATLGLGFKTKAGELITDHRPRRLRLMPFFSNLLPEGPLRTYLAGLADVKPTREFHLLSALGQDLPGALTVRPIPSSTFSGSEFEMTSPPKDPKAETQNRLRFSLAGVQLKFSAVMGVHGGLTIPAEGTGGSWIVKLPSPHYRHVPENEYSMMMLAKAVGITVPDCHLTDIQSVDNLPEGIDRIGGQAFVIRRFDRSETGVPIHIEDFAQIFDVYPEDKYDRASMRNIADVVATECGLVDSQELIRRITFNTLIGNADMHLKNWSVIFPDTRKPRLAPAYDFVATVAYIPDKNAALKLCRSAKFADFTAEELKALAKKARLPERMVLDTARETIALFDQHWREMLPTLPLAERDAQLIKQHRESLSLAGL